MHKRLTGYLVTRQRTEPARYVEGKKKTLTVSARNLGHGHRSALKAAKRGGGLNKTVRCQGLDAPALPTVGWADALADARLSSRALKPAQRTSLRLRLFLFNHFLFPKPNDKHLTASQNRTTNPAHRQPHGSTRQKSDNIPRRYTYIPPPVWLGRPPVGRIV